MESRFAGSEVAAFLRGSSSFHSGLPSLPIDFSCYLPRKIAKTANFDLQSLQPRLRKAGAEECGVDGDFLLA